MNYNLTFTPHESSSFELEILIGDEPILVNKMSLSNFNNQFNIYDFLIFINRLETNTSRQVNFNTNEYFIYNADTSRFIMYLEYNNSNMQLSIELNELSRKQFISEFKKMYDFITNKQSY